MVSWGWALLSAAFDITSKGSRRWAPLPHWRYWPRWSRLRWSCRIYDQCAGALYTPPQLIFTGVVPLVLYGAFVFVQTVRHRGYFLTVFEEDEVHEAPPSGPVALLSFAATRFAGGSGCAGESTDPTVEAGIDRFGAPKAVVGVIIATLGAIARKSGGAASGSPQPPANEYEPGAGFSAREHRPDDIHGRFCIDCNHFAAGTRAWKTRGGVALGYSADLGAYIGNRADDSAARCRTPGHFSNVSVFTVVP